MRALAVLGLSTTIVVVGCYRTHTRPLDSGPALDAARPDAPAIDAWSIDAARVEVDARPEEPGICECCPGVTILHTPGFACLAVCAGMCRCAGRWPDMVCFRAAVADVPTAVEVRAPQADACYCGQAYDCSAESDGGEGITFTSQLCPGFPCAECTESPPLARCEIPARPAGRARAGPPGTRAGMFDLDVLAPGDPEAGAEVCIRLAPFACGATWDPEPFESDRACHESHVRTGTQVSVRVEEACDARMQPGHCTVSVQGSVVTVRPTRTPTSCRGFGGTPGCTHPSHTCVTPPLEDGLYTVVVEGLVVTDDGPPSTIEVSSDGGLSTEVCRGSRT